jgi:glycosyltransferase involved in cell wall biosynthesis
VTLLRSVGVVALVPDYWKDQWQPRHQLMSRLGHYFNVVWMNPAPHWRDTGRTEAPRHSPPKGMQIYWPDFWLPRVHRPAAVGRLLMRARVERARRLLAAQGADRFVLYIWRPDFAAALDARGFDLVCYHIDDEYTFSETEQPISADELRLLTEADQVFIHSRALMEKKGNINPHTLRIPNGVDVAAFGGDGPVPSDMAAIPAPRIGYAGYLKDQLDWNLLQTVAEARPEWSLVFVGTDKVRGSANRAVMDRMAALPNVHFLGGKTTEALAQYPRHFDVCIMPYVRDEYTRYIYPLKLHEYLATGRPVVGTPIDALVEHQEVVRLAVTAEEWIDETEQALASPTSDAHRRIQVAREHDWATLTSRVAQVISQRLGPGYEIPHERSATATAGQASS